MSDFEVTLGGEKYTVKRFSMAQLRKFARLTDLPNQMDIGFEALKLAMESAEPPVEDFEELRPEPGEMMTAIRKVLRESGLQAGEAEPPSPGAKTTGTETAEA